MQDIYKPLTERTPDTQYRDNLKRILDGGILAKETPQGNGAWTCFGTLPQMIFDPCNGVPMITERKIGYKMPIAEILAFINGARTIDEIKAWGCPFWDDYVGHGTGIGLEPNDMGPGSYGPAFAAFERPEGGVVNQFEQLIDQIKNFPNMRTHLVTPWKPYYTARGPNRKVIVAPCHGWVHVRILQGKLHMIMNQRSADMPIGVPHNMIQYAALHLMLCQVTGYEPGLFIHKLDDAHIYESQVPWAKEIIGRVPRPLPILRIDPDVKDLFTFRPEHFTIDEYDPHPAMKGIPYFP